MKQVCVFLADGFEEIEGLTVVDLLRRAEVEVTTVSITGDYTIHGAHASAIIYSIAETAKANNLKPYDYFEYLLEEIPKHMDDTNRSFLEDLLPWSPNLPEGIRKN